jgi:hypothetical protein
MEHAISLERMRKPCDDGMYKSVPKQFGTHGAMSLVRAVSSGHSVARRYGHLWRKMICLSSW